MWIFTSKGFVSCVRHKSKPGIVLVRARTEEHLKEFVGKEHESKCFTIQIGDYLHRAELAEWEFNERLIQHTKAMQYPNFKGSIPAGDRAYYSACSAVWHIMHDYANGAFNGPSYDEDFDPFQHPEEYTFQIDGRK